MKFGISFNALLGFSPAADDVIRFVQEAEEIGYHSLSMGEHVIIPNKIDLSAYPAGVFDQHMPWYDPMVLLAAIAGATKTIRIGTGIAVVPYRPPIQEAQAVATLDFISGGRCFYGAGVGWMREEFDALGVPFNERGRRTDEYLQIMKLLWSGSGEPFHGKFISFEGGRINPLPTQKPHPPLLIGGETAPALERVAKYGDGFHINWKTLGELESIIAKISSYMAGSSRSVADLYMQVAATKIGLVQRAKPLLAEYEALGVDEIIYSPTKCHSSSEGFAAMRQFADEFF